MITIQDLYLSLISEETQNDDGSPASSDNNLTFESLLLKYLQEGGNINVPADEAGHTLLFIASQQSASNKVKSLLLRNNAKMGVTIQDLYQSLISAETQNDDESSSSANNSIAFESLISTYLEEGGDINSPVDDAGNTLLILAMERREAEYIIKLIMEARANINRPNNAGNSPLHIAASYSSPVVFSQLTLGGANLDQKNIAEETPLDLAIQEAANTGNIKKLREVIYVTKQRLKAAEKLNPDTFADTYLNKKDRDGLAPMHLAALKGHHEIVQLLIHEKADVNIKTDGVFATPLNLAIRNHHSTVAMILLNNGATCENNEINEVYNQENDTLVHDAAKLGLETELKTLIQHGANIQVENKAGATPLHLAAESGKPATLAALINYGANVNAVDKRGKTALHYVAKELTDNVNEEGQIINQEVAAVFNQEKISALLKAASILINSGVDINKIDKKGDSVAKMAALFCLPELLTLLIAADADIKDLDGQYAPKIQVIINAGRHFQEIHSLLYVEKPSIGNIKACLHKTTHIPNFISGFFNFLSQGTVPPLTKTALHALNSAFSSTINPKIKEQYKEIYQRYVQYCDRSEADIFAQDQHKYTVMDYAIYARDYPLVIALALAHQTNPIDDAHYCKALLTAAREKHALAVSTLLRAKAPINYICPYTHESPQTLIIDLAHDPASFRLLKDIISTMENPSVDLTLPAESWDKLVSAIKNLQDTDLNKLFIKKAGLALCYATLQNNHSAINTLLGVGAALNQVTPNENWGILQCAVAANNVDLFKKLIAKGLLPAPSKKDTEQLIVLAMQKNSLACILELLPPAPWSIKQKQQYAEILFYLVNRFYKPMDEVEFALASTLISNDVDLIWHSSNKINFSILTAAAMKGNRGLIKLLLMQRPDMNLDYIDYSGTSAAMVAARQENIPLLALLIAAGASIVYNEKYSVSVEALIDAATPFAEVVHLLKQLMITQNSKQDVEQSQKEIKETLTALLVSIFSKDSRLIESFITLREYGFKKYTFPKENLRILDECLSQALLLIPEKHIINSPYLLEEFQHQNALHSPLPAARINEVNMSNIDESQLIGNNLFNPKVEAPPPSNHEPIAQQPFVPPVRPDFSVLEHPLQNAEQTGEAPDTPDEDEDEEQTGSALDTSDENINSVVKEAIPPVDIEPGQGPVVRTWSLGAPLNFPAGSSSPEHPGNLSDSASDILAPEKYLAAEDSLPVPIPPTYPGSVSYSGPSASTSSDNLRAVAYFHQSSLFAEPVAFQQKRTSSADSQVSSSSSSSASAHENGTSSASHSNSSSAPTQTTSKKQKEGSLGGRILSWLSPSKGQSDKKGASTSSSPVQNGASGSSTPSPKKRQ
jgi:ankyrin repeat protein